MMNHAAETEIQMLAKAATEFAGGELVDNRQETDTYPYGPFFAGALETAFKLDFLHITLPADLGGVGYMQDFGQEKRFRDAKHIQACFGLTPLKRIRLLRQIIA
jgi:alkylation response protein AidB-like acyl-CoA dehydrogenase